MGHQRLGKLPASKKLPEIIGLLISGEASAAGLSDALTKAANDSLERALKDPAFVEALWLMVKIPQAAKADNFADALRAIGVPVPEKPSATDIVAGFDAAIEKAQRNSGADVTDLSEMAKQAGISAFYGLMQDRLPSLWEPSREDIRTTLATLANVEKFSDLSQRFFTNFSERVIQYYLDRAIPSHVGYDKLVPSVGDLTLFDNAVKRHCQESTVIMRAFAKDWLGKNAFHEGKEISRKDVRGFASHAVGKIKKEMTIRSAGSENL